ncbi:MAG: YopX family protein [Bacteroidales bacterium]|nr:YopX family protein [Bacteroidales bacterium]
MRQIKFRGKSQGHMNYIFGTPHNVYSDTKQDDKWFDSIQYIDENGKPCTDYINPYSLSQFTGFKDKKGKEIYENDILSDFVDTDEGLVKSHKRVFWKRGSWHLDNSYKQDKTDSEDLWFELHNFEYEVSGNIFDNANLLFP